MTIELKGERYMITTLAKKNKIQKTPSQNIDNHMKKIVKTYLDLGLIDGYLDKDGKTILSKKAFDDWD